MGNPKANEFTATSFLIPKDLHKRLKVASIKLEDTMANIIVTALDAYLEAYEEEWRRGETIGR